MAYIQERDGYEQIWKAQTDMLIRRLYAEGKTTAEIVAELMGASADGALTHYGDVMRAVSCASRGVEQP